MASKLILDPNDPGVNAVLEGAQVGQPIVLSGLTIIPRAIGAMIEADVDTSTMTAGEEAEMEPAPEAQESAIPAGMPTTNEEEVDEGSQV